MPWKECSVMDERLRLVAQLLDGEAMSEVCRAFGISRKTGYKIFERYKEHGLEALTDSAAARVGTGLGGVAGVGRGAQTLIGGRKAMAQGTPETVVYVSNAGSKEVFVLAMNRATGALELIEKTPVPGTDKPSPASLPMATSPDKHFLYAQLRSEPYPVSTFAIDRTTGRLKHLSATPLVDQMAYINTDRTGKFLLAASYAGAKLAIYPINAQHIVEPKATQILDTKPKA